MKGIEMKMSGQANTTGRALFSAVFSAAWVCGAWLFADEEAAPEPEVAVMLGTVERMTLRAHVSVYGTVVPEPATAGAPAGEVTLSSPVGGLIREASAVEGANVAKGDVLYRFDARSADAALAKACVRLESVRKTLERQRRLEQVDGTSAKNVQEAESQVAEAEADLAGLEAQRALLEVASPIGGVVTRALARAGESATAGQELAVVRDPDRLALRAPVAAREIGGVKVGQTAEVGASFGGTPVAGRVSFVSTEADPQTDTVAVRISLPPGCGLLAGQVAAGKIVSEEREGCLAVPLASVFTDRDGTSAISLAKDGRSKKVQVTRGLCDGDWVEVKGEGVDAGVKVITTGSYALPDNTRIVVREAGRKEDAR